MVDLDVLKAKKLTAKDLRVIMEPGADSQLPVDEEREKNVKRLRERIRNRLTNGRDANLANWKYHYALDKAWDIPFNQTSVTLLQSLLEKDVSNETGRKEVADILKAWGFNANDILVDVADPKSPNKTMKAINVPAFFNIFVPLVRAYTTIRWARIMNLRHVSPFLKYEPALNNERTRLQSEVVTNRIGDVMSRQYGYWNVLKQAVFQMLHYSYCIMFPVEEWHSEEQWTDSNGKKKVVREGLRYHMPHPSRTFYDSSHRPSTFNTNTGCEFAGYWRVFKYKDIRDNKDFWNTDKISKGATEWWSSAGTFFSAVYNSCTIKFPNVSGSSTNDKETEALNNYYTKTEDDLAVLITEYFERIVPKDYGLGDYDCPVWFRFVIGGDDTILYCAPLPYNPIIWMGYDGDENREQNASLSLEVLPFQDQISNLLTQFILSVKQNLANITFVDTDMVGQTWIDTLRNWGEKIFRTRNFIPFSGKGFLKMQGTAPQAFFSHHFPALDTNGILMAIKTVLDIMERVLVMSSQEVGQAASHELREKEVMNIANATSTRLEFTSAGVDDAREAWKGQLYEGLMAYGDEEFYADVPYSETITPEKLKELGFTWDAEKHPKGPEDKKITVKVNKQAIELFTFASNQDWADRNDDTKLAAAMAQALGAWLTNPILGPAIGPEQAIDVVNSICKLAGFPKEFKLENRAQKNLQQAQEEIMAIAQVVERKIMPEIQKALQQMMDLDKAQESKILAIQEVLKELTSTIVPPSPAQYDQSAPPPIQNTDGTASSQVPNMAVPA